MMQKYHATLTRAALLAFFFLPLISPGSFSSSALLSSPPSFFLSYIIATLGALVKVCIISTEQYTTVLACMDFFNLYSQRTDYLLRLIDGLCYLVFFR
jgi:hypothetical protein